MSFTETDYYNRLSYFVTSESLHNYIRERSYPSISLDQYEKIDPTLPTLTDASLNCMIALAKGVYYLFYAVVIGLPSDWLTLKTHVFLANWDNVKSCAEDAYYHALALKNPLSSAFHTQEKLFLQECQRANPEKLTSTLQLPVPKRPTSIPTPPPPSSSSLPPKPKTDVKKSPKPKDPPRGKSTTEANGSGTLEQRKRALLAKGFSFGAPKRSTSLHLLTSVKTVPKKVTPPPAQTTPIPDIETSTLNGAALRERMHGLLGIQGLGSMGGTKTPQVKTTTRVPTLLPKAPSASFTPKSEQPKVRSLNKKTVSDFEKLFAKTRSQ